MGERRFTAYAGSAKGSRGASLVYLINDTLYKETLDEYNESRPACLIIVIDSYDELFDDMKDSEQAKELEAINSLLEAVHRAQHRLSAQGHEQPLHRSGGGA